MCDCLRQLWLLTHKNLILSRRNKVWTLFEVILPIIFLLPVTLLVVRGGTVRLSPGKSFEPMPLEGGAGDIGVPVFHHWGSILDRWCKRRHRVIAYSTHENPDSAEDLMNKLAARFSSSFIKVDVVYIKDEALLRHELRTDLDRGCSNRFAGGLIFNRFDTKAAKLDYELLVPDGSDNWNMEWGEPFDLNEWSYESSRDRQAHWDSADVGSAYSEETRIQTGVQGKGNEKQQKNRAECCQRLLPKLNDEFVKRIVPSDEKLFLIIKGAYGSP
nr:Protein CED-7, isoform b [Haemonchus contortus]